jgi:hypothetical protein
MRTNPKAGEASKNHSDIQAKRLAFFERYLTFWVLLCMVVGIALGKLFPSLPLSLSKLEFGQGSQVYVGFQWPARGLLADLL